MTVNQNATTQRERLEVFAHWCKPDYGELTIAGQVHSYTNLMVYQPTEREGKVNPMHVFLQDCHLEPLPEGTPLLLVRDTTTGEPLALHLNRDERALLWEKPAQSEPWIGIYEGALTARGPSDCIGADIIAISTWPGDDWSHVYVPVRLTAAVQALLQGWNAWMVKNQHGTAFRVYDVLHVSAGTEEASPLRSLVAAMPNAVYLEDWA